MYKIHGHLPYIHHKSTSVYKLSHCFFLHRPFSTLIAVYDDSECSGTLGGFEGWVNSSMISPEKIDYVTKHNLNLDCIWMIQVKDDWKVCALNTRPKWHNQPALNIFFRSN